MNRPWTVKLKDVATIERRGATPSDIEDGCKYVGLEHIGSGGDSLEYATVVAGELASNKFRFTPDHILYGKLRPYLAKIVAPDFDGVCSTDILPIRPGPTIDKRFLLHFLRLPKNVSWAAGRATGINLPRLSPDELADLTIPLPPLDEQRRIAVILDKADALRQKRSQAIALLDSLTQSIFMEMFGDLIANESGLPEGPISSWVSDFETGKNLAPAADDDARGRYRVLKVSAVTSGQFKADESKPLPESYTPPAAHMVRKGDLLFSRANTAELIGATALITQDVDRLALPDKLWRFSWCTSNKPNAIFIHALFASTKFREAISKRATGTSGSMKNISKDKVLSLQVGQPERASQDLFAARASRVLVMAASAREQGKAADSLFASLQHRAFSGQL